MTMTLSKPKKPRARSVPRQLTAKELIESLELYWSAIVPGGELYWTERRGRFFVVLRQWEKRTERHCGKWERARVTRRIVEQIVYK